MNRFVAALAVIGLAVTAPAAAHAQGKSKAAAVYKAPRGPDGKHPDLNGVWQAMNSAGWDIEPHAARAALQLRPGPVVPVPAKPVLALGAVGAVPGGLGIVEGGEIPYTPEAKKQRDANRADYLNLDPEVKCYLPGVPRANYMHLPFQVFQSEKSMLIAYEYAGAVRNILFTDPGPAPVDSWMGQSVAKWDGDTLVVTVTGMNDRTWFDRAGNFHSDQMQVVERWTPTGPGLMRYEATITDPATFTRPWKMSFNLYKRQGEDARLNQFKCVEFVEELMYGDLRKEPLK
ncbi:MAG: hypothetical protein A2790_05765 [Phenylobacterium sp. RIFCSPHIGHO2_01_FULL_69_31]|jgi:hypothetical protein|uniref:hypothetical protein n=1 Tax=Phenylobacterium sp. RIFCSPHIGHO2_01_FULL_69_31 TaxID=1801944 RepID=UPI0008B725B7|nr:hypothetical protein [Phenylobacterium sp. RIFCSPHIGHO2_01_FULL_69_31]OHB30313.1 MAG: hypothetical protein A2790_05765 [Phenylobacterium sp. RIFCSPHIGHO2_01_FULL_69_31]